MPQGSEDSALGYRGDYTVDHGRTASLISPFHHTPRFIREALEAIRRGDILAHDFVTEEISLNELPQAFERMKTRNGEIKLAVRP